MKKLLQKTLFQIGLKKVLWWKKVKNTVPWTYVISDPNREEIVGTLYEKELKKTNYKMFRVEKVIKRKDDELYAKWKGYDNSFNSWINKKIHSINELIFSKTQIFYRKRESWIRFV